MGIDCRSEPAHPPGSPEAEKLRLEYERERDARWANAEPAFRRALWLRASPLPAPDNAPAWWFLGFAAVVVCAFAALFIAARGSRDSERERALVEMGRADGSREGAFFTARTFVERKLVSPGSADWNENLFEDGSVARLGGGTWRVTSWVDSQNGFGALIRTHYTCTLRYKGDDSWTLVELATR